MGKKNIHVPVVNLYAWFGNINYGRCDSAAEKDAAFGPSRPFPALPGPGPASWI